MVQHNIVIKVIQVHVSLVQWKACTSIHCWSWWVDELREKTGPCCQPCGPNQRWLSHDFPCCPANWNIFYMSEIFVSCSTYSLSRCCTITERTSACTSYILLSHHAMVWKHRMLLQQMHVATWQTLLLWLVTCHIYSRPQSLSKHFMKQSDSLI